MSKSYLPIDIVDPSLLSDDNPFGMTPQNLRMLTESENFSVIRVRMLDTEELPGMIFLVHNSMIKELPDERH